MNDAIDLVSSALEKRHMAARIVKIVDVESSLATEKGENFVCDIERVKANVLFGSGKLGKISMIVKKLPSSEHKRRNFTESGVFVNEITIYRDILPEMENILLESNDNNEFMWGQLYDYRNFDRLVMEDLSVQGYAIGKVRDGLDLNHCRLMMRSLAKFHALSLILQQRLLMPLKVFKRNFILEKPDQIDRWITPMLGGLIQTMHAWGDEWKSAREKLNILLSTIVDKVTDLLTPNEERLNVLLHGDCWVHNIMFKYDVDSQIPLFLKFVDFQMCFLGSPALDIHLFLATSPTLTVLQNHRHELIDLYYESFCSSMNQFQYNGPRPSQDSFQKEIKNFGAYGIHVAVGMLPMLVADKANMPDLEQVFKNSGDRDSSTKKGFLTAATLTGENFVRRMKVIIQCAIEDGYI